MRPSPRHPQKWNARVHRLSVWSAQHPRLYQAVVNECRGTLAAFHGSYWRAGWALVGHAVAAGVARLAFPIRRFLHRFGWHDRRGLHPYSGCSLCEAKRIDEVLARELQAQERSLRRALGELKDLKEEVLDS